MSWNFDEILGNEITAAGEDPSSLVQNGVDWFHMNSAIYNDIDNSIIASSRENFVIKIDYDTSEIKWILGNPDKGWFVDFPNSLQNLALTIDGKAPIGQHALSIVDDNYLLLFNNGRGNVNLPSVGDSRTFSAVSMYEIDETARTATEIWTFENNQELYSDICSSAYETMNGDFIINFASETSSRLASRIKIIDRNKNVKFDLLVPKRAGDVFFMYYCL